ncbi:hypothetical protein CK510_20770 [Brunnivagina elsteri CCALA 953]|uniref:Uncharacterized protein n=2 Tax=Brunnivagina TaxID=3344733 RepID=A0A2A2TEW1_9CYAN|nr:hypothetical protein CK510_20770 [Calothrix elsteri CCALA 953]
MSPNLLEIERSICALSLEEQEWLLTRITKQVQDKKQIGSKFTDAKYMHEQLTAMASDLQIKSEIASINEEFKITESDGFKKHEY